MRNLTLSLLLWTSCEPPASPVQLQSAAIEPLPSVQRTWLRTQGVIELARLDPVDDMPHGPPSKVEWACEHIDDEHRQLPLSDDEVSTLSRCDGLAWCRWGAEQMDRAPVDQRDRLAGALVSCTGRPGRQIFDRAGLADSVWWTRALSNAEPLPDRSVSPLLRSLERTPNTQVVHRLSSVANPSRALPSLLAAFDAELTGSDRQIEIGLGLGRFQSAEAWDRHVKTCRASTSGWCVPTTGDRLLPGYTLPLTVRRESRDLSDLARQFLHEFPDDRAELLSALNECSRQPILPTDPYNPSERDGQVSQCARVLSEISPKDLHPEQVLAGLADHRELVAAQRRYPTAELQLKDLIARDLVPADATSPKVQTVAGVMLHNDRAVHVPHTLGVDRRPNYVPALRRLATLADIDNVRFFQPSAPANAQHRAPPILMFVQHADDIWVTQLTNAVFTVDAPSAVAIINAIAEKRGLPQRLLLSQEWVAIRGEPQTLADLVRDGLVVADSKTLDDWALERRWRTWRDPE